MTGPPLLDRVLDASLLAGRVPLALAVAGAVGGAYLLAGGQRSWWTRAVPVALACGAAAAALTALVVDVLWRPFPDPLPVVALVATGAAAAAVALAAAGARRRGRAGRVATAVALLLVVASLAQAVNAVYGAYPTLRTALGLPAADQVPLTDVPARSPLVTAAPGAPLAAAWRAPADMPATGVVSEVDVPGTRSGFPARRAVVYLPPAYLATPRAELPVLVLMAGQPGAPQDWPAGGRLAERMDAYAAAHAGLAPVVVVVDQLGDPLRNPLCVDSPLGDVATYLTVDVPAWIRATLQVDPDAAAWAIGGLSNGGTCALQTAVTAPAVYPTFVSISGESEPTLGDRASTVRAAFDGDDAAFAAVNPLDVLARAPLPGLAGYLVAGADDTTYLPQARAVYDACRRAGVDVRLQVLPGGHTFAVWGAGLSEALPWLGDRLGVTAAPPGG